MAFLDHNGECEFPLSKDLVYRALCHAIPSIQGMTVENADPLLGRIVVKAGVSMFSWGENIPIQLQEIGPNKTKVQITSTPKTGVMFGGAFDMGKNSKNIEDILAATSRVLQQAREKDQEETHRLAGAGQPPRPAPHSMSMIYVSRGGQQYGPYTTEQLRDYIAQGSITTSDLACIDGQNWVTVGQVL
jgi:hypothetical protein